MEKVNRIIQDASNEFQCHNFQTALDLYLRSIKKCQSQRLPISIKNNLKSSVAGILTILGDIDQALKVCNQVLNYDQQHWLCLLRRSQIYKKKMKFKKALKDIETMGLYAPDNMQVAAMKLEIKSLMSKPDGVSSESESEQDIDEEELLKFSNLKKIDRTSVSIMIPRGRQSRVTISGDSAFTYNTEDTGEKRESVYYAPQFICQRLIEIDQQLEQCEKDEEKNEVVEAPVIKSKPSRFKSILKNRQSQLFVSEKKEVQEGVQLIKKIHDIDGKPITSQNSIVSEIPKSEREVGFRKSIFKQEQTVEPAKIAPSNPKSAPKKGPRKSCLKRTSFQIDNEEVQKKERRGSRFQKMSRSSIDGKMIKSDKKKRDDMKQSYKQNMVSNSNMSDDDSDGGSYNIFGSKKIELTKQLRENLGIGSQDIVCQNENQSKKKQRTRSILKKNSILMESNNKKKVSIFCRSDAEEPVQRKAKKSVMFMH